MLDQDEGTGEEIFDFRSTQHNELTPFQTNNSTQQRDEIQLTPWHDKGENITSDPNMDFKNQESSVIPALCIGLIVFLCGCLLSEIIGFGYVIRKKLVQRRQTINFEMRDL